MTVNLDFGRYTNYSVSESRISLMLSKDKKSATHINLWEKFKDLFRSEKKSDAYNELYNVLHTTEGGSKLDSFNRLKGFAKSECQGQFKKEVNCDKVMFFINNKPTGECSVQSLIGVTEQTQINTMSEPEQKIFLDMLDTLREKELSPMQYSASEIRTLISNEHSFDVLSLYRPQEDIDAEACEWKQSSVITEKESHLLNRLNPGDEILLSQFSYMGYEETSSGVEFKMLHPLINYLLHVYEKPDASNPLLMENNVEHLNLLNDIYNSYHAKKTEIDTVLSKIYHEHDGTLNLSLSGESNNQLVPAPNYDIPSDNFSDDLMGSLDDVFSKWAYS